MRNYTNYRKCPASFFMSPHRLSFSNDDGGSRENDSSNWITITHLPSSTNSRKKRENIHISSSCAYVLYVGEVDLIDLIQCRLNNRDLHRAGESKAMEGLRFPSLVHFFFRCFHPSFYEPFLLIPHVFFPFSLRVLMFSLDFPVKYFPLLSYPVSPEQISLTLSSHVQLSTVEPRLTTTPFIRPPRYYGHIPSNQT